MIKHIVAVVDDSPVELNIFSSYVKKMGNEVIKIRKGQDVIDCFTKDKKLSGYSCRDIDVILLNLFMKDVNGADILEKIKKNRGNTQIIIITGSTNQALAIKSITLGAYDFIMKGDKDIFAKLSNSISNAIKNRNKKYEIAFTEQRISNSVSMSDIVSKADIMKKVIKSVKNAINSTSPVTIIAQEGCGRQLLAKIIHDSSMKESYPFVVLNCKDIIPEFADKILFGYDKPVFNGKEIRIHGKVKIANKGTLYLENVEYLPYNVQTKLFNFISYGEIEIHNSIDLYSSVTRIICATSKNFDELLDDESNNMDLLSILKAFIIDLPSLNERGAVDIEILANSFCRTFNLNERKSIEGITDNALKILYNHKWKKNVRELRDTILKAVILCDDKYLDIEHFPDIIEQNKQKALPTSDQNRYIDLFDENNNHKKLSAIQKDIVNRFRKKFRYSDKQIIEYLDIKKKNK